MQYKGYVAAIEYDDIEDLLYGHVVNTGTYSICNFAASDVEGLKREFKVSVEDYLSSCREDGIEPLPPYSGKINLHVGPVLHRKITLLALEDGVSVDQWIRQALEEKISALQSGIRK